MTPSVTARVMSYSTASRREWSRSSAKPIQLHGSEETNSASFFPNLQIGPARKKSPSV